MELLNKAACGLTTGGFDIWWRYGESNPGLMVENHSS